MGLSLNRVQNVVLLFSDPVWSGQNTIPSTIIRNLTALTADLAYSSYIAENLTVLTSKYSETTKGVLQGLLYVPSLDADDPCSEYERAFVPSSAVRQVNLPPTNYNLIALAPWFDNNCTRSYLISARQDPLRAFIFYQPSDDSSKPPSVNDPEWDLGDSGSWKSQNHYPIFAVSGTFGLEMMYQLSLYSGNLSQVPYGANITSIYSPNLNDYVRIWTQLTVNTPTNMPNIGFFVLAILGMLLIVIAATSVLTHYIWRRGRISLQRRVVRGEVNLEVMGIKRLTVPLDHLEKFPLFTYNYEPPPPPPPASPTVPLSPIPLSLLSAASTVSPESRHTSQSQLHPRSPSIPSDSSPPYEREPRNPAASIDPMSVLPPSSVHISAPAPAPVFGDLDYQPTCQICLEGFENRETIIRELPCGHIFHPRCIDEFLSQISSLCPLCKASMLPDGFCPPITNAMVRRERATRRLRERVVEDSDGESTRQRIHSWSSSVKKRFHGTSSCDGTNATADGEPGIELKPTSESQAPPDNQHGDNGLSEATRRRMRQMAGGPDDDLSDIRTPKWKAITRTIFPWFPGLA